MKKSVRVHSLVGDDSDSVPDNDVVEEDGDKQQCLREILESYIYDQSHCLRRNDIVSYYDVDFEDWMRVKIIGT